MSDKRNREYESSIECYIKETKFNPIIFIENSDYPFDKLRFLKMAKAYNKDFEFLHGSSCFDEVEKHGKGYGDALLIYEGLCKSTLLKDVDTFYKMTGRVFLKNSDAILKTRYRHKNEFIVYDGIGWCMTWLFKANKNDYLQLLGDIYKFCDDKTRRDMEICFWLRLVQSELDIGSFSVYPDIDGYMGTTTQLYTRSQIDRKIRSIAAKLGIFTLNSKTGKLFWKMAIKIFKIKPYALPDENIINSKSVREIWG